MPSNKADTAKTLEDLNPYEVFAYASYNPYHAKDKYNPAGYKRHKTLGQARSAVKSWMTSVGGVSRDTDDYGIFEWDEKHSRWQRLDFETGSPVA